MRPVALFVCAHLLRWRSGGGSVGRCLGVRNCYTVKSKQTSTCCFLTFFFGAAAAAASASVLGPSSARTCASASAFTAATSAHFSDSRTCSHDSQIGEDCKCCRHECPAPGHVIATGMCRRLCIHDRCVPWCAVLRRRSVQAPLHRSRRHCEGLHICGSPPCRPGCWS